MRKILFFTFLWLWVACSRTQVRNLTTEIPEIAVAPSNTNTLPQSTVVIKTCINWKGDVVSTEFLPDQSMVMDTTLINKAIRAAQQYKFNEVQGSANKCGNLTFKFNLKKKE